MLNVRQEFIKYFNIVWPFHPVMFLKPTAIKLLLPRLKSGDKYPFKKGNEIPNIPFI